MRPAPLLLLLLLVAPGAAGAQEEADWSPPWRTSYFPFLGGGTNDGPVLGAFVRYWQPAAYEERVTYTGALTASGGLTAAGSRFLTAEFDAPLLREGWRLNVWATANREARFGYFGLGNTTERDDDLVTDAQPFLYRVRRTRYKARVEVTREIRGPWQVALLGDVESARFSSLPGPSLFATDFGSELEDDDLSARLALIYDSRDNEFDTKRGLLLEGGAQVGSGGGDYTRLYAILRGYVPVREGTVVAARLGASGMGGDPPLNARFTLPAWNRPVSIVGGPQSHRALDAGRFAGRHAIFGNLEVRHDLLNLGELGAITLLGFVDAGRVFEAESFRLTTDDLSVGGGGGVALRLLRATIFTFNFAGGPDGFDFSVGYGWMF
jgi:outer membrane protein assembly factor BamA